jgi:hypothetical protein
MHYMQNGKNESHVCENVKVAQDNLDAMAIGPTLDLSSIYTETYIILHCGGYFYGRRRIKADK